MRLRRVVDVIQVLVLVGTAVFVVALFANDGSSPAPASGGSAEGAAVYSSSCAGCHGSDGGGGRGPALGDGAVVASLPDEAEQIQVISEGRGGMPAFGDRLSAAEIEAVTAYTREDL